MRCVVAILLVASSAWAEPQLVRPRCPDHSCKSHVVVDAKGNPLAFTTPHGFGPPDIQAMYGIDPSLGDGVTVAVVDAYGYQDLEADLAVYRGYYGLPPCTVASGCLTILNNAGDTTPLLPDSDQGWIGETALDVDMVSAACPKCKIVVVQTDGAGLNGLQVGQLVAAKLAVDSISDSWGGPEAATATMNEANYANAGIGTFASTGDNGFAGGNSYPATSAFVIGVGGVSYDTTTMMTTAWRGAGSACSTVIAKQTWAPATPCNMRASADISAIADPLTGVAEYVAKQGGWQITGGTSAASPISAALFAAAGHGDARPAFIYKHRDAFVDVTGGDNGTCGSTLCTAATGWDGPTGLGTPDQRKLVTIGNVVGAGPAVSITYPKDGAHVTSAAFTIQAAPDPATAWIEVQVDGQRVARLGADPWTTQAPPTTALGSHTVTVLAYDLDHNSQMTTISIVVDPPEKPDDGGICAASRPRGFAPLLVAVAFVLRRRRR